VPKRNTAGSKASFTKIRVSVFNGAVAEWLGKPLQVNLRTVWRSRENRGQQKSTTITLRPTAAESQLELNHQIDNNQNPEKDFVPRWETRVSWGVSFAISFFVIFFGLPLYVGIVLPFMSKSPCFVLISVD
jgi:hypothetical protein